MTTSGPANPVDSAAALFEGLWRSGEAPPDVFAFLRGKPCLSTAERAEVVRVDQQNRWRLGRPLSLKSYLKELPDVASQGDLVRLLIDADRKGRQGASGANAQTRNLDHQARGLDVVGRPQGDESTIEEPLEDATAPLGASGGETKLLSTGLASVNHPTIAGDRERGGSSLGSFALDDLHENAAEVETLRSKLETLRLTLVRKIGAGGMGVVYEAYDQGRSEIVALKTMRKTDPQALVRFKQEFRSLADIAHPNLVSLFQLFAVEDSWFFTMELVEGPNFLDYVRDGDVDAQTTERKGASAVLGRSRPFHEARLRDALRQVATGVHHLHGFGKLHRDIKPTNVLVAEGGRAVVLDFGLTTDLKTLGSQGPADRQIVGTAAHMSPEQSAGREESAASDWYSVGVMLYQALTDRLPFEGSVDSIMAEKQLRDPPSPESIIAGIPGDLSSLCRDLLDRDPARRPTGPMILERLQGHPSACPDRPTRIFGRSRHRRILASAYDAMKAGKVETVFLYGRSGTGKSTLLRAFLDDLASDRGAVVLSGRCFERESVPFKALDSVIDALARYLKNLDDCELEPLLPADVIHLARLFPVLRGVEGIEKAGERAPAPPDPQEGRIRAFTVLRELLGRMGSLHPLVLAIDDLQWGDVDSAVLLADLIYSPVPPVLMFIATFRTDDDEGGRFLQILRQCRSRVGGDVDHHDLAVEPLGLGESREMALALLDRDDPAALALAHLVARESEGNPLFLAELVGRLEGFEAAASESSSASALAPVDLDSMILARIRSQPRDAARLLDVVAVSGRPIPEGLAFRASGLGPSSRLALGALRSARLVRGRCVEAGNELEVYHDRIRTTVLEHLPAERLLWCHKALATAYEESGAADPEILAAHLRGAGDVARAGAFYAAAAEKAASALAFDHAARLFRTAVELGAQGRDGERGLMPRLGDALANAGRGAEAALAYREAARSAPASDRLRLEQSAASQLLISGHLDAGMALLRTILKPLGLSMPSSPWGAALSLALHRAELRLRGVGFRLRSEAETPVDQLSRVDVCWTAAASLSVIDPIVGADFQTRGLLLALRAGEPGRIARALAMEAAHVASAGRTASRRVARLIAAAHELAETVGSPHARGIVSMARGVSALLMGEWKTAFPWFQEVETQFRNHCSGVTWELDTVHILSLWALYNMGEINAVKQRVAVLEREAREKGDLYVASALSNFFQAAIRIANDDAEPLNRSVDETTRGWPSRGLSIQKAACLRSAVQLELYRGRVQEAWDVVESFWPDYLRSTLPRIQLIRIQMNELRSRAALAVADQSENPEPFLKIVEKGVDRLSREPSCWAEGHVHFLRAGIAACRNNAALALHELGAAARAYESHDMALQECAMRLRATEIRGGEQGRCQGEPIFERMKALGLVSPKLWTWMAAPGFSRVVSGEIETNF